MQQARDWSHFSRQKFFSEMVTEKSIFWGVSDRWTSRHLTKDRASTQNRSSVAIQIFFPNLIIITRSWEMLSCNLRVGVKNPVHMYLWANPDQKLKNRLGNFWIIHILNPRNVRVIEFFHFFEQSTLFSLLSDFWTKWARNPNWSH